MITLIKKGDYSLTETKAHIKILTLDKKTNFAWINATAIGEILVNSNKRHKIDHILAVGKYRLYDVRNEPDFVDLKHLELLAGEGVWQGYLLPTGLPTIEKKRNKIIPAKEVITKSLE